MSKIIICITNDIEFDRRIKRTVKTLSRIHDVEVISRNKTKIKTKEKITCIFSKGFLFYAEYDIRLLFLLLGRQFDIVVAVDYDTIAPATIAARIRSKKIVFDAHELFEESIEITNRKRVKKFWSLVGKFFVPKSDRAYTVSGTIAKFYGTRFQKEFLVVRNVPKALGLQGSLKTLEDQKIIIYQGVLNEGRKLDLLIDSVAFLPKEFIVWIVGEGDLSDALKKKRSERVIFHSWVQASELAALTSRAFLAYNLLDGSSKSYYYSLANKFFDYIQSGIPSLNSPFPEYEYYNERYNCCYTTDIDSPQDLAKYIIQIEQDLKIYKEKRKNSFLAALDLNWEKEENKLLNIYDFNRNTSI